MIKTRREHKGFTLIELLVVLAIIGSLLTIAVPSYFATLENSRETALRQSLSVMRDAIDHYRGDVGKYPDSLQDLVSRRYLRNIPSDPITGVADAWVIEAPTDAGTGAVRDVRSGAPGNGRDGTAYGTW
ncbi:MAG TPA: type II secretion system protein [Ramlibacter sp.]|nr:type II secretion system protein [Ramlibacter sp.]